MIDADVTTVARVVKALGRELEGVEPQLCVRIGRALAAAFPELGLSPLASPLGTGATTAASPLASPLSVGDPIAPAVISESSLSSDPKENSDQSLSLSSPIGRGREGGDEGDTEARHPSGGVTPEWERETRELLHIGSEGEWRAVRAEVRRQLLVGVDLAREKGLAVPERLDVDQLEAKAVVDALKRARPRVESGAVGAPAPYLAMVVRGCVQDVLRYRARKAGARRVTRARQREEASADASLAREAEAAVPLGRAALQALKGLVNVEPSRLEVRQEGATG